MLLFSLSLNLLLPVDDRFLQSECTVVFSIRSSARLSRLSPQTIRSRLFWRTFPDNSNNQRMIVCSSGYSFVVRSRVRQEVYVESDGVRQRGELHTYWVLASISTTATEKYVQLRLQRHTYIHSLCSDTNIQENTVWCECAAGIIWHDMALLRRTW